MRAPRRRVARAICLAILFSAPIVAQHSASLAEKIDRALESAPGSRTAFWGIQIVDLSSGKTLYELNADHFFVPASNTKLLTTAMALTRLGPNFTFLTRVLADNAPNAEGVVDGPLRLIGRGDPNLSGRAIPYQMNAPAGDPLAAIQELAAQIAARGVKRVTGDILGDDTWYVWEPYATGWGLDDPKSDDGPPISALTVADNAITVSIRPGAREGELAALSFKPPMEYYRVDNRVRTGGLGTERRLHFDREPGSRNATLWGTIPLRDRGVDMALGMEDPALYAAIALKRALEDQGVAVEGEAAAVHLHPYDVPDLKQAAAPSNPTGVELARRASSPLIEDLRITDKVSQNLHAELALRAVGRARRNVGSFEAGLEELKTFLLEAGVEPESYTIHDGSGLARLNLITPSAIVKLLRHMYAGRYRSEWISLLPVGGHDGTLSNRFGEASPAAGRVHAKTGSLSHVSALSGYLERPDGVWLAFSILVNNYNSRTADVRGVMDRICNLMVE